MFFEGSEKKATVVIDNTRLSLLTDINDEFWHSLVSCCHAHIISSISNQYCKAFLLSESSLFVWDDHFLILTCGETRLVNAVEYFIKQQGAEVIKHVNYQRKNEYFAHAQPSSFGDDIRLLSKYIKGDAYRFGELDSHHNFLYQFNNHFIANTFEKTFELVASQISKSASTQLTSTSLSVEDVRQFLKISEIIPGFIINDFVFDPFGYSLNAIKGKDYITIHVTPQEDSSYVSFESNINLLSIADKIVAILQPKSLDLLCFNEFEFDQQVKQNISSEYVCQSRVYQTLANESYVCFSHFIKPEAHVNPPLILDITRENNAL